MLATIFISHLTILGLSYKSIQSYQRKWSRDETWVKITTYFHEYSEDESTNFFNQILCNICFDFLTCSKLRKKMSFLPNKEFVCLFFQLRNMGEKICGFAFGKFVKTCRDLDNR